MNKLAQRRRTLGDGASLMALIAAAVLSASGAQAAAPVDQEVPDYGTRVDELVVTGTSAAVRTAPVKASLEATEPQAIISRDAMDQFVPATADYTQIVNLSPSLSGTGFNGPGLGEAKTTLRGFQDGQYNITYDGIPWGDANGPTHHSTSFFPSSTIGAVVVDRGPGAAGQLGQANFGGSINLFSPEVSDVRGGSQAFTAGSWNTLMSVTKLNTGTIDQLNGAKALFNFQELKTDGYLTNSGATAYNQLARVVIPLAGTWKITLLGTYNYTKVNTNDSTGATLAQTNLYGKNFGLTKDPSLPTFDDYNVVTKHTSFDYIRLNGDILPNLKLENTLYTYYYKNDTESALDVTLTAADIAARKGLQSFPTPGGKAVVNGHVPGYIKMNQYRITGDMVHLEWSLPFGTLKPGVWVEHSDTTRFRYDYDATLGRSVADYRQPVLGSLPQNVEYNQHSGWDQYQPFVDFEWRVTPQLTLTPGVKYVHFDLGVDAVANQKTRTPLNASETFAKTLYFLTANYKLRDNLALYGQYATGFLVPDISAFQVAGPNLKKLDPQTSTNYQAGAVYHGGQFVIDADVYYIDFNNKQGSVFNPATQETDFFNLGGVVYKGAEGQITYAATRNLSLIANGSVNSAETKDTKKQVANAPKTTAAIGGLFHQGGWSVSLLDKYTGEQWAGEGEPAAYRIPGYQSADLTVVYSFGRYRLEGAVYNLTDSQKFTSIKPGKTVPYDQYYFQPERNFQASIKASF